MKKILFLLLGLFSFLLIFSAAVTLLQRGVPIGEKVALIRIEGVIVDSKNTIEELRDFVKDQSIKAIVVRVDSPGGAVAPSQEIYEEVKKAGLKKNVVVSMGSVAASGGYYISSAATKIIANPGTLTGSIGVIMEVPNIEGLMNKIGVKTEVIKSGKHKDIASVFRGIGAEERGILQGVLDDVHWQFIKAVAEGRRIPPDEIKKIADGRVFTGKQALEKGLVDELGNLEDAIKTAGTLAGIKGEPEVVSKKEKFSLFEMLRGNFSKELSDLMPTVRIKFILTP